MKNRRGKDLEIREIVIGDSTLVSNPFFLNFVKNSEKKNTQRVNGGMDNNQKQLAVMVPLNPSDQC